MPAPDEDVVYGLLTLAGTDVALPLAVLREVVPCPPGLYGLPASSTGLLGAVSLRDLVLPVLDLRPVLGRPAERRPQQVVVVVASGGQVLGLLADEVRGVTHVPTSALSAMTADSGDLLFSHTFRHPDSGAGVSVLDAAAVLRRPGVPTVADAARGGTAIADATTAAARRSGPGRKLTLLKCGPHRLALDVDQVHTTLPRPAPEPSVLSSDLCRGVMAFAGSEVPVVDPLVLLGLGRLRPEDVGAGVVLDLGHGHVVLAVTALLDLVEVADGDVLPVPAFAVPRPGLLAGMAEDAQASGALFVLDGAALLAEPDLVSLAAVNTPVGGADAVLEPEGGPGAADVVAGAGQSYLTYSAGIDLATPLEQVAEILPFPAVVTPTEAGGAVVGVVVHRRAAVPVLCLTTLVGRPSGPRTASSCLLLVAVDQEHVAFAVDGLRGIHPLTWTDADQPAAADGLDPARVLRSAPLVRVGTEPRLLPDLDLQALARQVRGPGAGRTAHPVGATGVPSQRRSAAART